MKTQDNVLDLKKRVTEKSRSPLDEIVRKGAQQMLQRAIETEVEDYITQHSELRDENGHRMVVRNGRQPARALQTGAGNLMLEKPRVHDRRRDKKFTSAIVPPYVRRSPTLDALIPALYLRGISTGDFQEALEAVLGEGAPALSPATIMRLKENWQDEYEEWNERDLSGKRYSYIWADGIYLNVRLTDERPCVLVVMGATEDGTKELIGLFDGERESKLSWKDLLLDLKRRGFTEGAKLAVADGALGFWPALEEVYPETRHQRCWVHKTRNVLNKLPKKLHGQAKSKLHEMYMAPTKADALETLSMFLALYGDKYPKACRCLTKDRDVLFTFYDFPAAHWKHIRTTNPIESTFATVRHRTRQTKGCGSRLATLSMVFKLAQAAERRWRKLDGSKLIAGVIAGATYINGEMKTITNAIGTSTLAA